jgi:hypothetical protein
MATTFDPDATAINSCHQTAILLNLCYDFLTTASPATLHELREFLTNEGLPPHTAVGWLIDMLGLMALNASTCHGHTHTTALSRPSVSQACSGGSMR